MNLPVLKGWRLLVRLLLLLLGLWALARPGPSLARQPAAGACPPLPPPAGATILVSSVSALVSAVNAAPTGTTILVADGVYPLNGVYLRFDTPGVTLRSAAGDREAVILDGNYQTTEIIQITASNVTIASLTLREAYNHPIHVMSEGGASTLNTRLYDLHILDPGQQAVKVNPAGMGGFPDDGTIACSQIELTDAGRARIRDGCYTGGIDAHQARGWTIRDNLIEGFWCDEGLSEHAIHFWRGGRDTLIERNLLRNNARGIGLGLVTSGTGRTYPDDPCPGSAGYVDDFGGVIRNNMILAADPDLFASAAGFDCGICLWNACNGRILHNTIFTFDQAHTWSAVEWRFPNTFAEVKNNLTNAALRARDGATASLAVNRTDAVAGWFVGGGARTLHLGAAALPAIDQAVPLAGLAEDFDGQPRPFGPAPDLGADEWVRYGQLLFLPVID